MLSFYLFHYMTQIIRTNTEIHRRVSIKPVLLTDIKMEAYSEEGIRYEKSSTSSSTFQW